MFVSANHSPIVLFLHDYGKEGKIEGCYWVFTAKDQYRNFVSAIQYYKCYRLLLGIYCKRSVQKFCFSYSIEKNAEVEDHAVIMEQLLKLAGGSLPDRKIHLEPLGLFLRDDSEDEQ
ncbi:hypothetical protein HHK36_029765 [Tetracentron sinense]|uniref:Uncharacterized protein n=1 Tax=Tetracentron sinense TaxID=13715 RepID=A0A834YA61_TETSI|nr:hypothetical protein HHK36_029765 [Tetracentron sinense]